MRLRAALIVALLGLTLPVGSVWAGVETTVHNLSLSGPGEIKSTSEEEVCIFCHAAHVPQGQEPLWNRAAPTNQYRVYKSATMRSNAGQPDGASKLCLSCHDGTIALGKVLNRSKSIPVKGSGARGEIPGQRRSNLGTDLSGTHPISIGYTAGIANARNKDAGRVLGAETLLAAPGVVPRDFLDPQGKVQCTTCHDAHKDDNHVEGQVPHFWRRPTVSEVCEGCHSW